MCRVILCEAVEKVEKRGEGWEHNWCQIVGVGVRSTVIIVGRSESQREKSHSHKVKVNKHVLVLSSVCFLGF